MIREQQIQRETELRQLYILVNCQQIFLFCKGFHYIYIRGGETEPYIPVQTEQIDMAIAAVQQAVKKIQIYIQSNYRKNIHDANPWLQITR